MIPNVKKIKRPTVAIMAFILGVALSFYLPIDPRVLFIALVVSLVLLAFRYFVVLALWLCLTVGFCYCHLFIASINSNLVTPGCYEGKIVSVPKSTSSVLEAGFKTNQGAGFAIQSDEEVFYYRDSLEICFESGSQKTAEGGYGRYLLSRYQSRVIVKNPDIKAVSPNRFWTSFFAVRENISNILRRIYIGDKGVLASGLILGGSQNFSDSFKVAMKSSGTTHLVAVSGYNVSIITIVLFMFLRKMISRKVALTSSIVILLAFCIISGASASVVRASIMGGLFIASKALGRKVSPLHLLLVAVFLMILQNPFALFDVGLQLSFFATLGLVLSLDLFQFDTKRVYLAALAVIPETLIAQVFTFPILLYHFEEASIISAIPNALILPLVPLGMLMVFVAAIVGLINMYLGIFVGFGGEILLRYFVGVIRCFGNLSFSKIETQPVPFYAIVVFYVFVIIFIQVLIRKINEKKIQAGV